MVALKDSSYHLGSESQIVTLAHANATTSTAEQQNRQEERLSVTLPVALPDPCKFWVSNSYISPTSEQCKYSKPIRDTIETQ